MELYQVFFGSRGETWTQVSTQFFWVLKGITWAYTWATIQNSQTEGKGKFALRYVICLILHKYNSCQSKRHLTHHFGFSHGLSVRSLGPSQHHEQFRHSNILVSGQFPAEFWLDWVFKPSIYTVRDPLILTPTTTPGGAKRLPDLG